VFQRRPYRRPVLFRHRCVHVLYRCAIRCEYLPCSSLLDKQLTIQIRIALTTFSVPQCYTGFTPASNPTLRSEAVSVPDVSTCFRTCINYVGASVIPALDGSSYSCICDQDAGDIDEADLTNCAKGTLVRFRDHAPGETVEGDASAPGPSTAFVKRQKREQLRLLKEKEATFCPVDGTACFVGQGMNSWECVEVQSDLGKLCLCQLEVQG
jgi:hypothetical protein